MINNYYLMQDGQQSGPFTHQELIDSSIQPGTLVLSPLNPEWQDAIDLPEFSPYFKESGIYFPTSANVASFWWRLLAYFIDYAILLVIIIAFGAIITIAVILLGGSETWADDTSEGAYKILGIIIFMFYNAALESTSLKGSLGKVICTLAVVDNQGAGIDFVNALGRNAGKIGSGIIMGFGFLNIFWDYHNRGWHDQWAKTCVVHKNR